MDFRVCNRCTSKKSITCFPKATGKSRITPCRRRICSACIARKRYNPAKRAVKAKIYAKTHVSECVLRYCRNADKRRGHEHDLSLEFVRDLLSKPCSYCGDTLLRMTLDRIENKLGHTRKNVVPACVRCNYARRDMPYQAWLELVPALKSARLKGLFGDWTGGWKKLI